MQINLSLLSINSRSPYQVQSGNGYSFSFRTRFGHTYEVGFTEDYMLSDDGLVFQFFITCLDTEHPPKDSKVRDTITIILEEFFRNESVCLVYICDTHDGRQSARQRLFASWFSQYHLRDQYMFSEKCLRLDGIQYFVSLICRMDNSYLADREQALDELYGRIIEK